MKIDTKSRHRTKAGENVFLDLGVGYVAEQIARYGGHQGHDRCSLYPYFFSRQEEEGLAHRLATFAPRQAVAV